MALGAAALLLGAAYYLGARPPGSTVIALPVPPTGWWHLAAHWPAFDALPSLLHVFAFSILTVAVTGVSRRCVVWLVPLAWLTVDTVFECLQLPAARAWLESLPLPWLRDTLLAGRGTFDPLDMAGLFLGAALAAAAIARMESDNEHS